MEKKTSDVDYVINTPGRRKSTRLCHVNMLKPYHSSDNCASCRPVANVTHVNSHPSEDRTTFGQDVERSMKLQNSDVLSHLSDKLGHLPEKEKNVIKLLVEEFSDLFPDVPGRTTAACHEVDVGAAHPIKQHPYWLNPTKLAAMRQEVDRMALLNRARANGAPRVSWSPNQKVALDFALISGGLIL